MLLNQEPWLRDQFWERPDAEPTALGQAERVGRLEWIQSDREVPESADEKCPSSAILKQGTLKLDAERAGGLEVVSVTENKKRR